MSIEARCVTAAELLNMPDDGFRYELIDGGLRKMNPAGGEHGMIVARLTWRLAAFVDQDKLGVVFGAETGFRIRQNPDTVRAPDIAFVRAAKIPASGVPRSFWPGAPDLAVEVVSPGDSLNELALKIQQWLQAGAESAWAVDPHSRTVAVYDGAGNPRILSDSDMLAGEPLLPGFRCEVRTIFGDP